MGVRETAAELGMRVMTEIMSDPEKAEKLAAAMVAYQRGRETVKDSQEKMLHGIGLATQQDVASLGRRLGKLRRRTRRLLDRLAAATGSLS